jgi:hypothetical protein
MNSLYKYFKFTNINKNTIESLLKGTIYFCIPEKLNDPFDCNLDIEKAIKNSAHTLGEDKFIKSIDKEILKYFIIKLNILVYVHFLLN